MMDLFWTPAAMQDRDDIYDYIEADNPAAALALDELLQRRRGAWSIIPAWVGLVALLAPASWSRIASTS
jgi:hypothetical protein